MTGSSPGEVRALADQLRAQRVPFVSATVVRAERPTSAKPGDVALVLADGTVSGFVGGECARASVQVQAMAVLGTGEPVLLRISPDAPSDDAAAALDDPARSGVITVHNPCLSGGALEIFLEPALPPPLVVVHGDAPIAYAVARLAERLGYAVAPAAGSMPDGVAAVVIASHGRGESDVLVAAVEAGVPYIGLVASPRRGAAVVEGLAGLGVASVDLARIRTPAGLDIGALTPDEVALSILAEIVSTRPRRPGPARPERLGATPTEVDPVCGMAVVAGAGAPSVDRGGRRYWFCGSGCREAFAARPEAFVER